MHFFAIIGNLRFQDALDIVFLTVVVYYLYSWFRATKAFKALVGLLGLGIIYTVARAWGLFLTTWVFQIFWQVLVILLIILFQSEIRQVLEKVNPIRALGLRKIAMPEEWIPGFTQAIFRLAEKKIGALAIIERGDLVEEHITGGQSLDGEPNPELLISIFQTQSPLHDGAALIKGGRITKVACYLPLSSSEGLPKQWGTRHRAALGLSERCDAWVVVVSEERGEVSLAAAGKLEEVNNSEKLSQLILEAVAPLSGPKKTWTEKVRFLVINRWRAKLVSLALVSVLWLLLAGQQNFQVSLRVPVDLKDFPEGIEIVRPVNPEVTLTVRGVRKDASTLKPNDVNVSLDLSFARAGTKIFRITRDRVVLGNDRLLVVGIDPPQLEFEFRKKK
jgi:diadenylate cyclase